MQPKDPRATGAAMFRRRFDVDEKLEPAAVQPTVILANLVIQEAINCRAASVHAVRDSDESGLVRFEIDGVWREVMKMPGSSHAQLMNRLKMMANLDISKRPSQEGSIDIRSSGNDITLAITARLTPAGDEEIFLQLPTPPAAPPSSPTP